MSRQNAITLIELIIVMVVVGIISAVAYPEYNSYLRHNKRQDAIKNLRQYQLEAEEYISANGTAPPTGWLPSFPEPLSGLYSFTFTNNGGTDYTIRAIADPNFSQGQDEEDGTSCTTLTMNHAMNDVHPPECR